MTYMIFACVWKWSIPPKGSVLLNSQDDDQPCVEVHGHMFRCDSDTMYHVIYQFGFAWCNVVDLRCVFYVWFLFCQDGV